MHPGFAFKYPTPQSVFQKKLLAGRSGRIICTMDAPPWYFRLCIGAPAVRMMKNSILKFCGVKPVRTSLIGSVRFSSPEKRERWIKQMQSLGRKRK
jgi:putative NADPH-quinone reductase